MRCHDFHLSGYEVRQFGGEIVLHLEVAGEESHVRFSEVELYHFVHTGGTIIFGIDEVPVSQILDEFLGAHPTLGEAARWRAPLGSR